MILLPPGRPRPHPPFFSSYGAQPKVEHLTAASNHLIFACPLAVGPCVDGILAKCESEECCQSWHKGKHRGFSAYRIASSDQLLCDAAENHESLCSYNQRAQRTAEKKWPPGDAIVVASDTMDDGRHCPSPGCQLSRESADCKIHQLQLGRPHQPPPQSPLHHLHWR
jgi:hypothetical protein